MKLLALDLGTTTGWAIGAAGKVMGSGCQTFKPSRFEGGGMRYLRFRAWLDDLHATSGIGRLAFEEVRNHPGGTDAAHVYGGFMASLTAWCEEQKIPYEGVPVGTIKKHWTGKGNSGKDVMIKVAKERGFNPQDDNEADALAILHWMMIHATPRTADVGPALHKQSKRRVPVEDLGTDRPRVRRRLL